MKTSSQHLRRPTAILIWSRLKKGSTLNGKTFKVHLDGYNLLPFLKGDAKETPRKEFLYWSDDGDLMGLRVNQWKVAFMEQHTEVNPKTPLGYGRVISLSCARPCCMTCG